MTSVRSLIVAFLLCACLTSPAQAELGQQLRIGEHVLVLNGAGSRTKAFLEIYESGLYLRQPSSNAQAILDADDLMAIRIRITSSMVSRSSLMASLQEGFAQSTGGHPELFAKETNFLMQALKDEVKKNDVYDFINVPTKGLYVLKNGAVQAVIPGVGFKKALFGIWLSDSPVDKDLRQAMLAGGTKR